MWENSVVEKVFDDGWRIIRPVNKEELTEFGELMRNCARSHSFWTNPEHCPAPLEYIFVLVDPQNKPRMSVHCKRAAWLHKKHPLEAACKASGINKYGYGGEGYMHGNYYDHQADNYYGRGDLAYYEQRVREARDHYEAAKARALEWGPLGRDNPYKQRVDSANKAIGAAEKGLKAHQDANRLRNGHRFMYRHLSRRAVKLVVLGIQGRGYEF